MCFKTVDSEIGRIICYIGAAAGVFSTTALISIKAMQLNLVMLQKIALIIQSLGVSIIDDPPRDNVICYPDDDGNTVDLSDKDYYDFVMWQDMKADSKVNDDLIKGYTNNLKQAIGSATYGLLPNGVTLSLKS